MTMIEFVRVLALATGVATFPLAIAVLVLSYLVLRPRPLTMETVTGSGAGFLFLHIVLVTVGFQGFVAWGMAEVIIRINEETGSFRSPLLVLLAGLLVAGYTIIFRVELARLRLKSLERL